MNKEILLVADAISNAKDVDKEIIFEAIEAALEMATKKREGKDVDVKVTVDRRTGDYTAIRRWNVIADDETPSTEPEISTNQITLTKAREIDPNAQVGVILEQVIPSEFCSRTAAQTAKFVIIQKVREAERAKVRQAYEARVGQVLTGVVRKVNRDWGVLLDLGGGIDAFIPKSEMIPAESIARSTRLRGLLYKVEARARGPQLFLSRTRPEMLIELFRMEVPEIGEELIVIKGAARDPGSRAKIAVKTNDGRIDPIGACVGMRGSRVQAVSSELFNERIDIILWDDNPAQLVINAMSPAEVSSIVMDEDTHIMDVAVKKEQLSQAIGRNGQNARLASELTGWTVNVVSIEEADQKSTHESERLQKLFIEQLGIEQELAQNLVSEGFTTLEEVAYVLEKELLNVAGLDEISARTLQTQAKAILTARAQQARLVGQDLSNLNGIDEALLAALAQHKILTRDDLAELSVDDLLDIADIGRKRAGSLIMAARAHWFNENEDVTAN